MKKWKKFYLLRYFYACLQGMCRRTRTAINIAMCVTMLFAQRKGTNRFSNSIKVLTGIILFAVNLSQIIRFMQAVFESFRSIDRKAERSCK